jgi:hypothetical protein
MVVRDEFEADRALFPELQEKSPRLSDSQSILLSLGEDPNKPEFSD